MDIEESERQTDRDTDWARSKWSRLESPAGPMMVTMRPVDFSPFWEDNCQVLRQRCFSYGRQLALDQSQQDIAFERVGFWSLGESPISGYLLRWCDSTRRPLVVHTHRYDAEGCRVMWRWARAGFNVFGFDIRGYGRSCLAQPAFDSEGRIVTGRLSPENSFLCGAVCDFIQAGEVASEIVSSTCTRVVFHGAGFAGLLAFLACGVRQRADLLVVRLNSHSDSLFPLLEALPIHEANRFASRHPEEMGEFFEMLEYFDPLSHAHRITCPTFVGLDAIRRPAIVEDVLSRLSGPTRVIQLQPSPGNRLQDRWPQFEQKWMEAATT